MTDETLIERINQSIETTILAEELEGKIVRFKIANLPSHLKQLIDSHRINELTKDATFFKLIVERVNKTKDAFTEDEVLFEGVINSWKPFTETLEQDGSYDFDELVAEGLKGLEEAMDALTKN